MMPNFFARSLLAAVLVCAAPTLSHAESSPPIKVDDPVVMSLGARLRCPVCQGMPIGESPAPMAQDMMREVRRMRTEEGKSEAEIASYFTDRYGAWILLDPPASGFGLLVWMLPPAVLLLALAAALGNAAYNRRMVAERALAPEPASGPGVDAALLARLRRDVQRVDVELRCGRQPAHAFGTHVKVDQAAAVATFIRQR